MAKKIEELREKREKIIQDQRSLIDKADAEKRSFTPDEENTYQNLESDFDKITVEINEIIKEAETKRASDFRKKQLQDREEELRKSQGRKTTTVINNEEKNNDDRDKESRYNTYEIHKRYQPLILEFRKLNDKRSTKDFADSYRRYLIGGMNSLDFNERNLLRAVDNEVRALQADSDPSGGYLVAPEQMVMQIIQELDNLIFVRQYANVISLPNAASLGSPARDSDIGDVTWTAEIGTGSEDNTLDFAKRELRPHPLARRIKVSKKLIRISLIDIVAYIARRFSYKLGVVQENAFLNGNGINQPLGVFTASDAGISTARDVSTGNTATNITPDGLIECKYSLPKQYRMLPSTRWCFHRDGIKRIRKMKDGEGQYIWKQGLSDAPDTILEMPFEESEYAPNTFTTGKYVGILGDWNQYWIADSLSMEIQVLTELYAETNQNGYICRQESDGMPVLEAAFSRVKLS